jgi:hypothetical protein
MEPQVEPREDVEVEMADLDAHNCCEKIGNELPGYWENNTEREDN